MTPPRAAHRDHTGLEELSQNQDAVVTRRQLTGLGFRSEVVRDRVAAGAWRTFGHRVVLLTGEQPSSHQLCRAALLHSGPRSRLAGLTALEVGGLQDWVREDLHVLVPAGTHVAPLPRLTVHRTHRLTPVDTTDLCGLAATTPARSALDAARWERSARTAGALMIAVVQQRLCTPEDLEQALRRFVKVKQQVAIAGGVDEARAGAESKAEVDVSELLVRAGFPTPRRQVEIRTSVGLRRVDLGVDLGDGRLLVVEVDGPHHDDPGVRLVDAVKEATLVAQGHHVVRVPTSQVREHRERVLVQFIELHALLLGAAPRAAP
jgi:hypothetical protein